MQRNAQNARVRYMFATRCAANQPCRQTVVNRMSAEVFVMQKGAQVPQRLVRCPEAVHARSRMCAQKIAWRAAVGDVLRYASRTDGVEKRSTARTKRRKPRTRSVRDQSVYKTRVLNQMRDRQRAQLWWCYVIPTNRTRSMRMRGARRACAQAARWSSVCNPSNRAVNASNPRQTVNAVFKMRRRRVRVRSVR